MININIRSETSCLVYLMPSRLSIRIFTFWVLFHNLGGQRTSIQGNIFNIYFMSNRSECSVIMIYIEVPDVTQSAFWVK